MKTFAGSIMRKQKWQLYSSYNFIWQKTDGMYCCPLARSEIWDTWKWHFLHKTDPELNELEEIWKPSDRYIHLSSHLEEKGKKLPLWNNTQKKKEKEGKQEECYCLAQSADM